jgi:predicted dehydrogenase
MDYASHVIDLINYLVSPINKVYSSELKKIYSKDVDDAVYAMVSTEAGISGMISVNWSDETYRKMSTSITIVGENGKIISDANECKIYLKEQILPEGYNKGWNIKYVTELNPQVDFYLRGEEYSAQLDYFVSCIKENNLNRINNFESAAQTDNAISIIRQKSI